MAEFDIRVVIDPQDSTRGVSAVHSELRGLERAGVNIGRRIAAALAAAFTGISAGASLRAFSAIEQGLIGVAKTTDLTTQEMAQLESEILGISRRLPFARTELLSIAQAAGQLGVRGVPNLTKFSETIAKLGVASDLSGDQAAVALTRILTVTREGPEIVDRFASAIVALGNNFAATESEIADAATSVAAAGAVFGVTAAESAALGASFRSVGVESEVAGTTVGKAMQTIEAALRQGGAEMKILQDLTGQTREQLRQAFEADAAGVFQEFLEGLGRVAEAGGSVNAVLEGLGLADQRILRSLGALAQNSELVARAFATANGEMQNATALNQEVERNANSVEVAYRLLSNAVLEVVESVGEALAPAFIDAANSAREFIVAAQEGETLPAIYDAITTAAFGTLDAFRFLAENGDLVAAVIGLIVARQIGLVAQSQAVTTAMAAIRRELIQTQIAYEVLGARTTAALVAQQAFARAAGLAGAAARGLLAAFGGPVGLALAVGIAANALGLFETRAQALARMTDSIKSKVQDLTGEFDDQGQSVQKLIDKYQELGRVRLADEIAKQEAGLRDLQGEVGDLGAALDSLIGKQGKVGPAFFADPEAPQEIRKIVREYERTKEAGEDVTDVVLRLADKLKSLGDPDVAGAILSAFSAFDEGQAKIDGIIRRIDAARGALASFNVPQTEAFVPLPVNAPGGDGNKPPSATVPTKTEGVSFADIIKDLRAENELLALNVRAREIRAEVLRAEDALERRLTDAQREQIEALVEQRQAIQDRNDIRDFAKEIEDEIQLLRLSEREREIRIEQLRLEDQLARSLTEAEAGYITGLAREAQFMRDVAQAREDFLGGFDEIDAQRAAITALFQEGSINADQFRDALRELDVAAMELRIQLGDGSFMDGFVSSLFRATEAAVEFQSSAGQIFADFTTQLSTGFSNAIGGMIFGTQKLSEALKEVARNAITQLISALINLGIQWVIQQGLALALGTAATAATSAQAAAAASAWAPAAALASLATVGANAGPAIAAVTATLALTRALASFGGGLPGLRTGGEVEGQPGPGGGLLARVSAGEFLVNAPATRANRELLERMNRGEPLSRIVADLEAGPSGVASIARERTSGGGLIRGPGTGTSDSIVASLPDGSFVVRESVARRYRPLLERINRGEPASEIVANLLPGEVPGRERLDEVPGLARGGLIVAGPSGSGAQRTRELLLGTGGARTDAILARPEARTPLPEPPQRERGGDTFQVTFAPQFDSPAAVDAYRESEAQILAQFGRTVDEIAERRRIRRRRF